MIKLGEVRSRDRCEGLQKTVLGKPDALVGVILHQVAHHIVEALLVLRPRANLQIQQHADNFALGVVRNRIVLRVVTPQPCIPTGFLGAHQTAARGMLQRIDLVG